MGLEDTPMAGWREREDSRAQLTWGNSKVSELTRGEQPRPGLWAIHQLTWHTQLCASHQLGAWGIEMSDVALALEESQI